MEGAKNDKPFIKDGQLFLYVPGFQEFLRTGTPFEKIDKKVIYHAFSDIGYTRKTVGFRDGEKTRTTSRWYRDLQPGEEEAFEDQNNEPLHGEPFL